MFIVEFGRAWINPQFRLTAFKVTLIVGTVLIVLNHGGAIIHGEMTMGRWFSAVLTYLVPYTVNIHGQWTSQLRQSSATVANQDPDETIGLDTPATNPAQPINTLD